MWKWIISVVTFLTATLAVSSANDRVGLTGRVTDNTNHPIANATVIVHSAGVKHGYSTFCPTCYTDCGKRTVTNASGTFVLTGLDSDLWFDLIVVREGYSPIFLKRVDPSSGHAPTAFLSTRMAVTNGSAVVRARVVDGRGAPVSQVVVEPQGIATPQGSGYGTIKGLDSVAVSNANGEFEVAYAGTASKVLLLLEPPAMAPKLVALPTGTERQTVSVSSGATVRGRLVAHGKPVGNAEIGMVAQNRWFGPDLTMGASYQNEIRIGTQPDGTFIITNVPAPGEWYIYGKMESLSGRGVTDNAKCETKRDEEEVNVGEMQVEQGHVVEGKVLLSNGKSIADGMRITISSSRTGDSQSIPLASDGSFKFTGVRSDKYSIFPSVKGYRSQKTTLVITDRDVKNFEMVIVPR